MARLNDFLQYTTLILFFSTFTSAWPKVFPDVDALVVRQQNSNTASATITPAPTASGSSGSRSVTVAPSGSGFVSASTNKQSNAGSNTGSNSGSNTGSNTGRSSTSFKPTITAKTSYDARLPAGGITMLTPAPISGSQYYKIGDYVTWAWNYTSLSATPTALNILASCASQNLYTLAMNQTIHPSATGAFTWDTDPTLYSATPLVQATCTLIMYDADSTISAIPEAGYLQVFNSFQFGMYSPQSPTDSLNGQILCATCSGAVSAMERSAWMFMLGMCTITVLSFTWFMDGVGIIW